MDPNWMNGIAAVVSAGVAVAALVVAVRANRRSDVANEQAAVANHRAAEALHFQKRIDDREREFRQVSWHGSWASAGPEDSAPSFVLANTGLTEAKSVTLVIEMPSGAQAFFLGNVAAGGAARAQLVTPLAGALGAAVLALQPLHYAVHWSSPLGQADKWQHVGRQIF